MASVKLGVKDSETTLVKVQVSRPTGIVKGYSRRVMIDHSKRVGMFNSYRTWTLNFLHLTKAELDDIITEVQRKQQLRFQDSWESDTWYDVIVTSFSYDYETITASHYVATLELEEV